MNGKAKSAQAEPDLAAPDQSDAAKAAAVMEDGGFAAAREAEGVGETPPPEESAPQTPDDSTPENEPAKGEGESEPAKGEDEEGDDEARLKLDPKTQEAVDRRIGKEVARRKEAEETLATERAEKSQLILEKERLEEEMRDIETSGAVGAGIHPAMLAASESELQKREAYLWEVERFCQQHTDEGFTSEDGKTEYTAKQVRARLLEVQEERMRILPAAREALRARAAAEAEAAKVYPVMKDPASPEALEAKRVLRKYPVLKLMPDHLMFIADALAGRKARQTAAKATPAKAAPKAPAVPGKSTPKPATPPPKKSTRDESVAEVGAASKWDEGALEATFDK